MQRYLEIPCDQARMKEESLATLGQRAVTGIGNIFIRTWDYRQADDLDIRIRTGDYHTPFQNQYVCRPGQIEDQSIVLPRHEYKILGKLDNRKSVRMESGGGFSAEQNGLVEAGNGALRFTLIDSLRAGGEIG